MPENGDVANLQPEVEANPTELGEAAESPTLEELVHTLDQEVAGAADAVPNESVAPADETRYLLFTLGDTLYGAQVGAVIEIATVPQSTPVPNVPGWVRGVANLRGDILAVLDLRVFFGLESLGRPGAGRMLVARAGNDDVTAGIVVDAVKGVTTFRSGELEPPTAHLEIQLSAFLLGVREHHDRLVAILDFEQLLTSPDFRQFEATAA